MKVKCCVVTAIIFFLMANTYAWSEDLKFSTGLKLLEDCEANEKVTAIGNSTINVIEAQAAGYCVGLVSGISAIQGLYSDNLPKKNKDKACFPHGATNAQNIKVVLKYLKDHPAVLHFPDTFLVYKAFLEAYPCK